MIVRIRFSYKGALPGQRGTCTLDADLDENEESTELEIKSSAEEKLESFVVHGGIDYMCDAGVENYTLISVSKPTKHKPTFSIV